jgi:hypothetical protein
MHRDCNPPSGYSLPGRITDWELLSDFDSTSEVIMVGRCLHLHLPLSAHTVQSLVLYVRCLAWSVDLGPLIGDRTAMHPCSSTLSSALQSSRADSAVWLTLTVPHLPLAGKPHLTEESNTKREPRERHFSQLPGPTIHPVGNSATAQS